METTSLDWRTVALEVRETTHDPDAALEALAQVGIIPNDEDVLLFRQAMAGPRLATIDQLKRYERFVFNGAVRRVDRIIWNGDECRVYADHYCWVYQRGERVNEIVEVIGDVTE